MDAIAADVTTLKRSKSWSGSTSSGTECCPTSSFSDVESEGATPTDRCDSLDFEVEECISNHLHTEGESRPTSVLLLGVPVSFIPTWLPSVDIMPYGITTGSSFYMEASQGPVELPAAEAPVVIARSLVTQESLRTLVLKNLPSSLTRELMLEFLDSKGLRGSYDFVYLPWSFEDNMGLGYSIVNFVTHVHAEHARLLLQGSDEWIALGKDHLEVLWNDLSQGLESNIERYRNSPVMHKAVPSEFKPMMFIDGIVAPFPASTKRRQPRGLARLRRSQQIPTTFPDLGMLTLRERHDCYRKALRQGITRVIHILNIADMDALFAHLSHSLAPNVTYRSPGVCDEVHDASEVVRFHERLREAIPELRLTLDCAFTDKWTAIATGTQVKPLIPHLPVGTPIKFILESRAKADFTGKIVWVSEKFTLAENHTAVVPDIQILNTSRNAPRNVNEEKHHGAECQPCAYFAFKPGGCSKGSDCPYCHLCTKSQAKCRKRAMASQAKLLGELRRASVVGLELDANIDRPLCAHDDLLTDDGF